MNSKRLAAAWWLLFAFLTLVGVAWAGKDCSSLAGPIGLSVGAMVILYADLCDRLKSIEHSLKPKQDKTNPYAKP